MGGTSPPATPRSCCYSKRLEGTWRFVGVMFQTESITETPPSAFGGLDVWHYHEDLCFEAGRGVRIAKEAECLGGAYVARTPWELHVWTQPGASGLFAHDYAPHQPRRLPTRHTHRRPGCSPRPNIALDC